MTSGMGAPLQDWMDALVKASDELASTTLGFTGIGVGSAVDDVPKEAAGAYLALVGDEVTLQLAVVSDPMGCRRLSGALLGMPDEELEGLSSSDMADAMGEVINIVAGGVKTRMAVHDSGLKLGLPMFIEGHVHAVKQPEQSIIEVHFGEIRANLLVFRQRRSS